MEAKALLGFHFVLRVFLLFIKIFCLLNKIKYYLKIMFNHTPKKSLGQNFLTSTDIVKQMIEIGRVEKDEYVVEIGPGKGALTQYLLERGAKVIAIEKDDDLSIYLQSKFKDEIESSYLKLINNDVLKEMHEISFPEKYKLIANIPYNITGKIISEFLSLSNKPELILIMIQKEVAERIARNSEKESILSLAVKAYGEPKFAKKVSRGLFFPDPKVDSALLLIDNISDKFFKEHKIDEKDFFDLLHASFAHKRKKMISNLKEVFKETAWGDVFKEMNLDENIRAEDLKLDDFGELTKKNRN